MPAKLTSRDDLGLALTFLRRIRGWEQAQLAAAAGVAADSVLVLEGSRRRQSGRRRPSFKTLGPVMEVLGVDLGVLAEMVAVIRNLRMGGSAARPTGSFFAAAPELRREITSLAVTGRRANKGVAPGGEMPTDTQRKRESARMFGLALAFLRWIKGRTQEDLAARSGVRLESIRDLEEGGRERSTPMTLDRLASGLDVVPATLLELAGLMSKLRQGMAASADGMNGGAETRGSDPFGAAPALRRGIAAVIQVACSREFSGQIARNREAARQRAVTLWALLEDDGESWFDLVQQIGELQTSELCELVCDESVNAAADSAARARRLADLAVKVAERVGGPEGWRTRLLGYAGFHLANSLRVDGNDLPAADEELERARVRWNDGAVSDPGLLNAARVMSLEASLRRAQRRVPEALVLLDQALAIDRWGETPSLLLGKARALYEHGDYEASIGVLQETVGLIDADREPRRRCVVLSLLLHDLCLLDRHAEAAAGLAEMRALGRRLGNRLDQLRIAWLEGKIAAGTGRPEEAIVILQHVRAEFQAQRSSYDLALVTVELAEVLVGLCRHADVKALAQESLPIFRDQGVMHAEAQRALALFCRAAAEERASGELLHDLLAYLYRSRHNPQLRFEDPA